jgi:hypothetical protein
MRRPIGTRARATALAALTAVAIGGAVPAQAQVFEGIVVIGAAKRAAQGATLVLLDRKQQPVDTAVADVFGSFSLQAPKEGRYYVLVRRPGFYPIITERFELQENDTLTDSVFLTGRTAEMSVRQVLEEDVRRLFGSSISAAFSRYIAPEQMDSLRTRSTHLGDLSSRGRLIGLQYINPPNGCLRFSGERGCAQIYLDGLAVYMRPEQISTADIVAVMAMRPDEMGAYSQARGSLDNSRFGAVLVYTSRFADR